MKIKTENLFLVVCVTVIVALATGFFVGIYALNKSYERKRELAFSAWRKMHPQYAITFEEWNAMRHTRSLPTTSLPDTSSTLEQ
jgi:hypothetical protein